jgi:hypothetical protein
MERVFFASPNNYGARARPIRNPRVVGDGAGSGRRRWGLNLESLILETPLPGIFVTNLYISGFYY